MIVLEAEMKQFSTLYDTHNRRLLIRTLRYVTNIVVDGKSLYGERV